MPNFLQSAKDRKAVSTCVLLLSGLSGVGKTTQIKHLVKNGKKVLVIDGEAGLLAVDGVEFDSINVRELSLSLSISPWKLCRHLAVLLAGTNPAAGAKDCYGKAHFDAASNMLGGHEWLRQFDVVFIDSISEMARYALQFSMQSDECKTKQGNIDKRQAYGISSQEIINWMRQLQHTKCSDVVLSCGLRLDKGEFSNSYSLMIEGSKPSQEVSYIFDECLTLVSTSDGDKTERSFYTDAANQFGYPAKDRSGRLNAVEPANLATVINKIKGQVK